MCEPTTLAVATLALTAVGGIGGAVMQSNAAAAQAEQARAAANYQSQVARNRQAVAEWQANDAKQRGEAAAQRQEQEGSLRMGTAVAALAAQGTDMSGSSADIIGDVAAANKLDKLTVRSNAEREAYGYKVAAFDASGEASFRAQQAGMIRDPGAFPFITSLIGTAGQVASKWGTFRKEGIL